jgi:hypothetical protein
MCAIDGGTGLCHAWWAAIPIVGWLVTWLKCWWHRRKARQLAEEIALDAATEAFDVPPLPYPEVFDDESSSEYGRFHR